MEIKIKKFTEEAVQITLPHYRKSSAHVFKIYSEEHCIVVTDLKGHYSISQVHSGLAFNSSESVECTEEEFNKVFNEVKQIMSKLWE